MGQHRIQRQILQSFSFQGRQKNSQDVWFLRKDSFQPQPRSIRSIGFFDVACSSQVDRYITDLEDGFKEKLLRFSQGRFAETDVGRETYDFIAMHYVRSKACSLQIHHMVDHCWRTGRLTHPQAEAEYLRLTSHQDLAVFRDLVDSVARVLTHYMLIPLIVTGPSQFLTSNKIVYAGQDGSEERRNFVWFPLSPSTGLCLRSDQRTGQILGPIEVNPTIGEITFAKIPESVFLRCQEPEAQEVNVPVFTAYNHLMVHGSTELFAANPSNIDHALQYYDGQSGFRYTPTQETE